MKQNLKRVSIEALSKSKKILPIIGIVLFGIVLYRSDVSTLLEQIKEVNWMWIAFSVLLGVPFCMLKSERWRLLLKERGVELSFGEAFRIFTLGLLAGLVTPGQLGELYKVVDIKKIGGSYKDGILTSLGDRILDLLLIIAMGSFYFLLKYFPQIKVFSNAYFFVFLMLLFSILSSGLWLKLFRQKTPSIFPTILKISTFTFSAYIIYVLRLLFLLWALDLSLPLVFFVSAMGVMSVISLLPLSIMGVGLRELSLFELLANTSITESQILSFSLLIILLYLFNGVIGAISWFWQYKN